MKRTGFKLKPRKPMKRSGFKQKKPSEIFEPTYLKHLKKTCKPLRQTKLRKIGKSSTAKLKQEIQRLLRLIVIARDGGCILRNTFLAAHGSKEVYQAEHLVERGNSATYADSRLIVCVCTNCHHWKHTNSETKKEYERLVKELIPKERVELWEEKEAEKHKVCRKGDYEWKQEIEKLKKELETYNKTDNKINL